MKYFKRGKVITYKELLAIKKDTMLSVDYFMGDEVVESITGKLYSEKHEKTFIPTVDKKGNWIGREGNWIDVPNLEIGVIVRENSQRSGVYPFCLPDNITNDTLLDKIVDPWNKDDYDTFTVYESVKFSLPSDVMSVKENM